jgi:hypothetical protein
VTETDLLANGIIPALGAVLCWVFLHFAMRFGRRQWLLDTLPTCKTTGVFIGMVELKGTAESEGPLVSHFAAARCVHFAWSVEESWSRTVTEHYTDDKGRSQTRTRRESGWTTVADGGQSGPFYLKDDVGIVRIQPAGAAIEAAMLFDETCGPGDPLYYGKGPAAAIPHSDHRRRFHETGIVLHAPLYVVGRSRLRDDVAAAEIALDNKAEMFLISTRSEQQVSRGYRAGFWWLSALAFMVVVGAAGCRDLVFGRLFLADIPFAVISAAAVVVLWLLAWTWTIYNGLIGLRERVRQGWSNVDIQLQRRHELIPLLVNVVTGMRDHERKTQSVLAHLRAQLGATAPGEPGIDPAGCMASVRLLAEACPGIRSDRVFLDLERQLADTEERIALARSYFNAAAALYNTRIAILPDCYVAALAGLAPRPLLTAENFERRPEVIRLAD